MAHSVAPPPATATTPISPTSHQRNSTFNSSSLSIRRFPRVWASHQPQVPPHQHSVPRRTLTVGLTVAMLGLTFREQNASAARRPPPPPPEEKKDPNVSGVQAKVLASKKRKEAMKEAVAKLREQGKAIQEPPQ